MSGLRSARGRLSRCAFVLLWFLDHLIGTRKCEPFRAARVRLHRRLVREGPVRNRLLPVPELPSRYLDSRALKELAERGPVVFRGMAAAVPALRNWTLPALGERYGHLKQACQKSGAEYYKMEVLRFSELLDSIEKGQPTHVLYGGGKWDVFNVDPRMREELNLKGWADERFLERSPYRGSHIFISGKDHWSPIHTEMGHILSTQVRGSRRWTILGPSQAPYLFPEISRALMIHSHVYANAARLREESFGLSGWECVLEEGDVLFCPMYHWHFVETLRASVSVATKWATFRSLLRNPIMSAFFATSRSPSVASYLMSLGKKEEFGPSDFLIPKHLR